MSAVEGCPGCAAESDVQPTAADRCECWAEDHPWSPGGGCGLPRTRRLAVRFRATDDSGPGVGRLALFLMCDTCADDALVEPPPGVVEVRDVGPL